MADDRSLREKLEAMRDQDESPQEAYLARLALLRLDLREETARGSLRGALMATPNDLPGWRIRYRRAGQWIIFDIEYDELDLLDWASLDSPTATRLS